MNQRPTTSDFVSRFATLIAICLTGLMPVFFVSDASAALIDIVVVGTWESASINIPFQNPFGLVDNDKFVIRSTYDDSTFFIGTGADAQGVTASLDPSINLGTSLDFIVPHNGPNPNPVVFDQSDHINIGFAATAQVEFDGPNLGSPGNFRNLEFHFENNFGPNDHLMHYDTFMGMIQEETTIFNIGSGLGSAATGSGPEHLTVVQNDITANAGGPYVFDASNLSQNTNGTSGGGSGFAKTFDWAGPGGTLSNSPGASIAFGLAESGLTNTTDTEQISLEVTESFTEFTSAPSMATVSYANTAPVVIAASGVTEVDLSITFSATFDDVDLVANALVAGFETVGVDFLYNNSVFLAGNGNIDLATQLGIFGGAGIFEVIARATDLAGATGTLAFNVEVIPEPTTCGLALAAVIFFAAGRRRVGLVVGKRRRCRSKKLSRLQERLSNNA